jgi:hypothetical protein
MLRHGAGYALINPMLAAIKAELLHGIPERFA